MKRVLAASLPAIAPGEEENEASLKKILSTVPARAYAIPMARNMEAILFHL